MLIGNAGNDSLLGRGGNDSLYGGAGNDVLDGETGTDFESGGDGNDRFVMHVGFARPECDRRQRRHRHLRLPRHRRRLLGVGPRHRSGERLFRVGQRRHVDHQRRGRLGIGQQRDDPRHRRGNLLDADGGNDGCYGDAGNDLVRGGAGNDFVDGEVGKDTVLGGEGDDNLSGGFDADNLYGGAGGDIFTFKTLNGSNPAATDRLLAGDGGDAFDNPGALGTEKIDVSALYAGNFIFGGTGKGHLWCINSGTNTRVVANVDNDAAFEFQLDIVDAGTLANQYKAVDFIL